MKQLTMRNQQQEVAINTPALRRQMRWLLDKALNWSEYEIMVRFVSAKCMAKLNLKHLSHEGPTDVITFDYEEPTRIGEIVICPAVAAVNAQHHNESIMVELARYLVHGLLHMSGYDDKTSAERGEMKREEDRLLRRLLNNG